MDNGHYNEIKTANGEDRGFQLSTFLDNTAQGYLYPHFKDLPTILRGTGAGVLGGGALGSLAALVQLNRLENDLSREYEESREESRGPGPGSMVINVPPSKQASDGEASGGNPASWAWSLLGMGAGGALGWKLADKVRHRIAMNKLQNAEEAARRHYISDLGSVKGEDEKRSQAEDGAGVQEKIKQYASDLLGRGSGHDWFDTVAGGGILGLLLAHGGAAYLTKNYLDSKTREQEEDFKPPKLRKVIFRTDPSLRDDDSKQAGDDGYEKLGEAGDDALRTLFIVHRERLRDDGGSVFDRPAVKRAMEKSGFDRDSMFELAEKPGVAEAVGKLSAHTDLMRTVKRAYIDEVDPGLKKTAAFAKRADLGVLSSLVGSALANETAARQRDIEQAMEKEMTPEERRRSHGRQAEINPAVQYADPRVRKLLEEHGVDAANMMREMSRSGVI